MSVAITTVIISMFSVKEQNNFNKNKCNKFKKQSCLDSFIFCEDDCTNFEDVLHSLKDDSRKLNNQTHYNEINTKLYYKQNAKVKFNDNKVIEF